MGNLRNLRSRIREVAYYMGRRRSSKNPFYGLTYMGVYQNLADVKLFHNVTQYHALEELEVDERDARLVKENFYRGITLRPGPRQQFFWSNMDFFEPSKKISVLDFGCGLRPVMLYGNCNEIAVRFILYDVPYVEGILRKTYTDENVQILSSLTDIKQPFDSVFLGSSLQYVESWRETLTFLATKSTGNLIIADTPCGNVSTFACAQVNVWPRILCRWIFGLEELTQLMESVGFQLVVQEQIDDINRFFNYPEPYHSVRHSNLLFARV